MVDMYICMCIYIFLLYIYIYIWNDVIILLRLLLSEHGNHTKRELEAIKEQKN